MLLIYFHTEAYFQRNHYMHVLWKHDNLICYFYYDYDIITFVLGSVTTSIINILEPCHLILSLNVNPINEPLRSLILSLEIILQARTFNKITSMKIMMLPSIKCCFLYTHRHIS